MNKRLNKDVNRLEQGVKGLYRSTKQKLKIVVACVLSFVLLVSGGFIFYNAKQWHGKVVILAQSKSYYQVAFYSSNVKVFGERYAILKELNLSSIKEFERKANVNAVTKKDQWESALLRYGILDKVDFSQFEDISKIYCYIIILDAKGGIKYQGFDRKEMVETLLRLGVKF